jgi:iron complex outermembrane receptor protein
VWGGGIRVSRHDLRGVPQFFFVPQRRTLKLANAFVQDTLRIGESVRLTLGLKLEDDPYSGAALLPNARATWQPGANMTLWAAASRAIRSPTPFDRDVVEKVGTIEFIVGGPAFRTEKLTAFELGGRAQPSSNLSLSVSGFYNRYDDLRSIEFNRVTLFPLEWGNEIRGHTWGFEAWGDYGVTPWWKLSAAFSLLKEKFTFSPNATSLLLPGLPGVEQQGNDPAYQASLKSSMNVGSKASLDGALRFVGARPEPRVSSYVELDARAAYNLSAQVQLSVTARNLLHARHQEYPAAEANPVTRKVLAGLQWRF